MSLSQLVFTVSLTCLLSACGASDRAVAISELSGDAEAGAPLYSDNCSRCHGATARGGSGPDLVSHLKDHDEAELIDEILEGSGGMPSFKSLEDQQIADIIAHIRRL